ncbi:MAG: sigma-70 family RNA polymerase sigma factor [Betaproteobacteria bacterium]|nr:sigma-70 family RNA polymerase sigma factor [Betaproteobacteria bacterium]
MQSPLAPPTLETLYPELRAALLAFLKKRTGDAAVAEDILHDVVVKALASAGTENEASRNLTGWLYAVARNAAMDYHRGHRPTEELHEDIAAESADENEALQQLALCLRPMAERLPEPYREVVLAAEFDGQPLRVLANAEGLTISAIKSRASRGRRMLHEQLVACCRVVLSQSGAVADYDANAARACAPQPQGCGKKAGGCAS